MKQISEAAFMVLIVASMFVGILFRAFMPHADRPTIPTPAPASKTPASTVSQPQDVAVVAVPSLEIEPVTVTYKLPEIPPTAEPPACATCAPAPVRTVANPYQQQSASIGPRWQRRGLFGGRFRGR